MTTADTALDLAVVRTLVRATAPGASVHLALTTPRAALDAAADRDLRWRALANRLADDGADQATVEAIGVVVDGYPVQQAELAVFATAGVVTLAYPMPGDRLFDRARYGAPADLVPLLHWYRHRPAHVVVLTDRTGAEVTAVPAGAVHGTEQLVTGPDDEIERNAPGGWSQPRYQRRAVDSWEHNAAAVAHVTAQALGTAHADLLLVGGDVRAVQLLVAHLPAALMRKVTLRHLPGGRGHDGSAPIREAAVADALCGYVAERDRVQLADLAQRGPGGAVSGPAATLAALAAGQVETLFVPDDGEQRAWYTTGFLGAATRDRLPPGTGEPRPGRMVDIAVRAALLTDAEVCVVDEPVDGGIAGLCRYQNR